MRSRILNGNRFTTTIWDTTAMQLKAEMTFLIHIDQERLLENQPGNE